MHIYEHLKGKRLLSLDIGLRRIGIAVCDILHITTTPLTTLVHDEQAMNQLLLIIEKEQPACIVVGLPKESPGQKNNIIKRIQSFVNVLSTKISLEIVYHDESYSSKNAVRLLVEAGTSKKKRRDKATIDKTAAAVILRSFLDDNGL